MARNLNDPYIRKILWPAIPFNSTVANRRKKLLQVVIQKTILLDILELNETRRHYYQQGLFCFPKSKDMSLYSMRRDNTLRISNNIPLSSLGQRRIKTLENMPLKSDVITIVIQGRYL